MGKVNWEEAKLLYLKDSRISYSVLARHYGVAKPTIQAHATKHGWADLRKKISDQRVQGLLAAAGDSYTEFEVRQLKIFRHIQAIVSKDIANLRKEMDSKDLKSLTKHISSMTTLQRTLFSAIKEERLILGIEYKPVRHPLDLTTEVSIRKSGDKPLTLNETIKHLEKALQHFKRKKAIIEKSQSRRP